MRKAATLAAPLAALALALPAAAQDHQAMDHAEMDHAQMDHSGHDMPMEETPQPDLGSGPPRAADAIWGADAMRASRQQLSRETGGQQYGQVLIERLETRLGEGEDAYLWDVQAFWGGDLDKFVLKSEGEGAFDGVLEHGEVQALWSHAIDAFFDLQAGARQDLESGGRTHAVVGVQGLAPYMIHLDAAAFLSDEGDLTARIEAEYDQKITQSLILQPRVELALSAQDIPLQETGSGLTGIEAGLRLRYEIAREFAPYLGAEYEAKLGGTCDYARAAGEDASAWRLLAGIRAWF